MKKIWKYSARQYYMGRFEGIDPNKTLMKKLISFQDMNSILKGISGTARKEKKLHEVLEDLWWKKRMDLLSEPQQNSDAPIISEAVKIWMTRLEAEGKSEVTRQAYQISMNFWMKANENRSVDQYMPEHDEMFLQFLSDKGMAINTVNKHCRHVSVFWKWAKKKGWIKQPPDFENVLSEYVEPDPYTMDEIYKILKYFGSVQDKIAFRATVMLCQTGMRSSECIGIQLKDINLDEGWINIRHAKGRKRNIKKPISDTLHSFLLNDVRSEHEKYYLDNGKGKPRWSASNAMAHFFRKVWNDLGVHRRQPVHGFRSFVATFALKGGASIYDVKNLLGHSTTKQTEGYANEGILLPDTQSMINKTISKSISIPDFAS